MTGNLDQPLFSWLPDWLLSLALVVIAIGVALLVHALVQRLVLALWASRRPMLAALVRRTRGVTRYAAMLFALSIIMPLLPLDPVATDMANRVFVAGFVLLIGWVVLLGANASADYYVARFRAGAPDDLLARKAITQVEVLKRVIDGLIIVIAIGFALMSFDSVRQLGVSLFASAGVVGIIAGVALRSILANFFAGLQIALTQPIRINDVVVVENENGQVEELNSTYVVIRIWDLRRLIVPLSYFIEKPFQNWTRSSSQLLGTVLIHADYSADVAVIRSRAREIVEASPLWDRQVFAAHVTDVKENTIEIRLLVSAADAGKLWDLRCDLREKIVAFIKTELPDGMPRRRLESATDQAAGEEKPREIAPSDDASN
jgi:small-conductance mechanosensitive channel